MSLVPGHRGQILLHLLRFNGLVGQALIGCYHISARKRFSQDPAASISSLIPIVSEFPVENCQMQYQVSNMHVPDALYRRMPPSEGLNLRVALATTHVF